MNELLGIDINIWLLVIAMMVPLTFTAVLMVWSMISGRKVRVIFFVTQKIALITKRKVKDGGIKIGKKLIDVNNVEPIQMHDNGWFHKGYVPTYVVIHDKAVPAKFTASGIKIISGENLDKMIDNKVLEKLLTPQSSKAQILWLIMGVVMGIMGGYILSIALGGGGGA